MPKSPEEMRKAIIRNLPKKTGKSLEEWLKYLETHGPQASKEKVAWLKKEYGLGHFQAKIVVEEAEKPEGYSPPTEKEFLNAQYYGAKASLRPIYNKLVETAKSLKGLKIEIRKTYVSLNRRRQFGIIKASTNTRIDLGLSLPGIESTKRLLEARSLGSDRITHKVGLGKPEDVNEEVMGWIRTAYELDEQIHS